MGGEEGFQWLFCDIRKLLEMKFIAWKEVLFCYSERKFYALLGQSAILGISLLQDITLYVNSGAILLEIGLDYIKKTYY